MVVLLGGLVLVLGVGLIVLFNRTDQKQAPTIEHWRHVGIITLQEPVRGDPGVHELLEQLRMLSRAGFRSVLLDINRQPIVIEQPVGMFMRAHHDARKLGVVVSFCNLEAAARDLLMDSEARQLVQLHTSRREALEAFAPN